MSEALPPVRKLDAALLARVREAWATTLRRPDIDAAESWAETGADSLLTLHLLLRLEKIAGRKLSFDLIDPDGTVADLAQALQDHGCATVAPDLPVVFLVPAIFGDEPLLAAFRRNLAGRVRFELVELPDASEPEALLSSMAASGQFVARAIMRRQPTGPISLAGYSLGASVAFEAARCLVAAGRSVERLGLLDGLLEQAVPGYVQGRHTAGFPRQVARRDVRGLAKRLEARIAEYSVGRRAMMAVYRRWWLGRLIRMRQDLLMRCRRRALDTWRPEPVPFAGFVCVSEQFEQRFSERWRRLCPAMQVVVAPGGHREIDRVGTADLVAPLFADRVGAEQAAGP